MNEERRKEFQRYQKMSDAELAKVAASWNDQDCIDYFMCNGYVTLDEFCDELIDRVL